MTILSTTRVRYAASLLAVVSIAATACVAGPGAARPEGAGPGSTSQDDHRTLTVAMHWEPATLTRMTTSTQGVTPSAPWQLFHATLTQLGENGVPKPLLAEALPLLGTDSWRVFPDGRMETTWHLRPNLTWHDGAPLVADDFVLSQQFTRAVALPGGGMADVEEFVAPDPRTVVIRYRTPNAEAGESTFEPLPRHILGPSWGPSLEQLEGHDIIEAFASLYFTTEFVGAGPYRLTAWEPGAFISGAAFPGYVNGEPRIGHVRLVWISDANTAVANLLSGAIDLATDLSVAFEQVSVLRHEWAARGEAGSILLSTSRTRYAQVQYRPEYAKPAALLDIRFRQALAHAIDRQAIVTAVLDSEPGMASTLVPKELPYYPELDQLLTRYALDLQRAEQLLVEMGFTKDREGFYGQSGDRLSVGITPLGGYDEREALVLADGWKRVGIEASVRKLSAAEQLDQQLGSTFPGLAITHVGTAANPLLYDPIAYFTSALISSPATRWLGKNRGAFFDPEIDRLDAVYSASLDRNERNRAVVQAMKLLSDQAAYFPLYYGYDVVAHTGSLVGPRGAYRDYALWKMEEWTWK